MGTGRLHATTTTAAAPPPSAPQQQRRVALGAVAALSTASVTVGSLTCSITPARDSQRAAARLTPGGRFGIVCRLDGGRWVLAGATPLG